MTPQERHGQQLFVVFATAIVLSNVGVALFSSLGDHTAIEWQELVLTPTVETLVAVTANIFEHWLLRLGLAVAFPFLWLGHDSLRRLVGVICLVSGALTMLACAASVAVTGIMDAADGPMVFSGIRGTADMLVGLALLFLPSLRAFFRYQREAQPTSTVGDWPRLALPEEGQPFPRLVRGGFWGTLLGAASGLLLSASLVPRFGFDVAFAELLPGAWSGAVAAVLAGVLAAALFGLIAGLAVGALPPKPEQSTLRSVLTRGLIAASACIVIAALANGIWAGVSGERLHYVFSSVPAGWQTGVVVALLSLLALALPVGAVAFVLGAATTLLLRDR